MTQRDSTDAASDTYEWLHQLLSDPSAVSPVVRLTVALVAAAGVGVSLWRMFA